MLHFSIYFKIKIHGKKIICSFCSSAISGQLSKVCSKRFNNSSEEFRLATLGKDFVNVRIRRVTLNDHEKLHDKVEIFMPANVNA